MPCSQGLGFTVRRLLSSFEPEFEGLLRIYFEAHPEGELKPASALARMVERPEYFFLVLMRGAAVAGFSISICFRGSDAALLEYMAVAAEQRNLGLGGLLFKETIECGAIAQRFLLVEVDSDKAASGNRADLVRRKNFYRKLGCREIEGLVYIMPRVSSALPPPLDMLVYKSALPQAIDKIRIRAWLEDCYSQVYQAPPDDRRIGLMLEPLPGSTRLI